MLDKEVAETYQESAHHRHLPLFLLIIFLMIWAFLAYEPLDRFGWFLENILVLLFVPFLIFTYKKFRLSNISYGCIFAFMVLHIIGGHYTYAEVPFGFWLQELFGFSRNHFDRIVHFSFGLLFAYPVREVFHRIASTKGFWGYWLPVELTLAFSAIFEILEWLIVIIVNPSAGAAYLGTQGDEFDAIKDMALAGTGALITMLVTLVVNWRMNKKFGAEMSASLTVKDSEPMGEVAIEEMEEENKKKSLADKFKLFQKIKEKKKILKEPMEEEKEGGLPVVDEPEEMEDIGSDVEKHNHSPEEILKLLQGENIHKASGAKKSQKKAPVKKKSAKKSASKKKK